MAAGALKSITLMGMSGVGKTYLSRQLADWGWFHYSCDLEIGRKFMAADLPSPVTCAADLSVLSAFIGKLGDAAKGGLPYEEFKRRQRLYYEAECAAIAEVPALAQDHVKLIHDSTGSLCEIMDEALVENLGKSTLFVYLKASAEDEIQILERARQYPKPLFFPPAKFDIWLGEYLQGNGLKSSDEMNPDEFARWVFPRLFESRLPKYQRLADLYGVTIPAAAFYGVESEARFLDIIQDAMHKRNAA